MKESSQSLSRFRNKPASKLKLFCSFNGAFRVRQFSKKLRYIGGENRIISVDRTITFSKLRLKISDICPNIHSFTLKYQLPLNPDPKPNDDSPLVLIASDDDVRCMVEEYDKLESYGKHSRLWVFVCGELYDNDDESSFDNNSNNNGLVGDDSLRKKVLKQQSMAKQSCESPLIDLDFGPVPNDSMVKNDPFQVNVTNGMGSGRMRPLNPKDGNVRNVAVGANASVESLMARSCQGLCNGGDNSIFMCNSFGGKQDFGNTGEMAFSNFNRENIMPWGASCGFMNNHLEPQSCSNRRFGSGYSVKSSCVGDRVLGAYQSGLHSHRFGVNDARYQRIYPCYLRNHRNNLVEVGNHRGVRLGGKIPVGKCYPGSRPNSNISKQGHSMRSYDSNLSSLWPGCTECASEGGASMTCSCSNKGSSTFDVQYGQKFREQGGPAISKNGSSNVVKSHLACHGIYNVIGDKFFLSHTAINHPSTFVRAMKTQEDQLTGSKSEQHKVQCHTLCDNSHRMPMSCKSIRPDLGYGKSPIDSEENANISGHSNNISSGCSMKSGTKNLQGGVVSSMDLLYKMSLSSSKEIGAPQNSSLHNAAAGRIDVHQEEIQQELLSVMSLEEKVDSERTCECSKLIGGISNPSASLVTHVVTAR